MIDCSEADWLTARKRLTRTNAQIEYRRDRANASNQFVGGPDDGTPGARTRSRQMLSGLHRDHSAILSDPRVEQLLKRGRESEIQLVHYAGPKPAGVRPVGRTRRDILLYRLKFH